MVQQYLTLGSLSRALSSGLCEGQCQYRPESPCYAEFIERDLLLYYCGHRHETGEPHAVEYRLATPLRETAGQWCVDGKTQH